MYDSMAALSPLVMYDWCPAKALHWLTDAPEMGDV